VKFLLDTNTCIEIIRRPRSATAVRFKLTSHADMGISIVAVGELWVGPHRKGNPATELHKVSHFLSLMNVVPFDDACALEFGKVAAELLDAGTPVDGIDMQIAATARRRGLIVVTHNLRHFSPIKGLQLEDWKL